MMFNAGNPQVSIFLKHFPRSVKSRSASNLLLHFFVPEMTIIFLVFHQSNNLLFPLWTLHQAYKLFCTFDFGAWLVEVEGPLGGFCPNRVPFLFLHGVPDDKQVVHLKPDGSGCI